MQEKLEKKYILYFITNIRALDLRVLSLEFHVKFTATTYIFTPFWEEYMQKFYTLQDLSILCLTFLAPKAYLNTKYAYLNMAVNLIYIINSGGCLSHIKCTSESSSPISKWIQIRPLK